MVAPIVDQLHDLPEADVTLLMLHVYEHGFRAEGCTWQWAKQQGARAIRTMESKKFTKAVQELISLDYEFVKEQKPLTYRALKETAK